MKRKFPLSWVIIGITLPALGTLAWNQFNWLEELQYREYNRIESRMIEAASGLSKRIKEEFYYLPSVFRVRLDDREDLESVLRERFAFWHYYSISPELLSGLYVIDPSTGSCRGWNGSALVTAPMPAGLTLPESTGDYRSFFGASVMDLGDTLDLVLPLGGGDSRTAFVLCALDKGILFDSVIPSIAREELGSSASYAFRILDSLTGKVLWSSEEETSKEVFGRFDLDVPLLAHVNLPVFEQGPALRLERIAPDYVQVFSFIKQRIKIDPSTPPDDVPSHLFSNLRLQIVNRDVSLAELSRRATLQNAILSFGVVLLLIAVMVVLAEANRRATKLARSQQEFIATVTHELKTPLAVISSAAQNLTDGLIKDQRKAEQYGQMIRKEALRLGVSIEHFLLYSNTNSSVRTKPERIPVEELVQSALRFTEEDRLRNEFRTEVLMGPEPLYVEGDRIALESVFRNLAQNAVRHAAEGKYLGIIVSRTGANGREGEGWVTVKVRDKGPGISARERKTVFEAFIRGRRAMDNQVPGNGVGLNLVRRIVALHGGTVRLESKQDSGCTFAVTLGEAKGE